MRRVWAVRFSWAGVLSVLLTACAPEVPASAPGMSEAPRRPPVAAPSARAATPPPAPTPAPLGCGDTEDGFEAWILAFRGQAEAEGIPRAVLANALADVTYDPSVIRLDRSQRAHKVPFEEFVASHLPKARVKRAKQELEANAALLARIEQRFGVPREVLVALWGLETDFGRNQGRTSSLQALATLAYDCRRSELFRGELASALRLVARGDLRPEDMVGAWAGELGQTQFLPSSYEKFGIDFDGDGRVDLVGSAEDALASTGNYLAGHGWRAGEPYREGMPNFEVLASWNKSEVYRKTVALFASKLARPGR